MRSVNACFSFSNIVGLIRLFLYMCMLTVADIIVEESTKILNFGVSLSLSLSSPNLLVLEHL